MTLIIRPHHTTSSYRALNNRDSQLKDRNQKLTQCEAEVKRLELKSSEELQSALKEYEQSQRTQEAVYQDELIKAQGLSGAKLVSDQYHAGICVCGVCLLLACLPVCLLHVVCMQNIQKMLKDILAFLPGRN